MNIKEQVKALEARAIWCHDHDIKAEVQRDIYKAVDTLEKLYKVYLAADRHTDNPMNLALYLQLVKAIAAVQESE